MDKKTEHNTLSYMNYIFLHISIQGLPCGFNSSLAIFFVWSYCGLSGTFDFGSSH